MPKRTRWIVTTDGARPVHDVVSELERAGFAVESVLEEIGSVTGTGSEKTIARVRSIAGVADVSRDSSIDLGPPGNSTW